MVQSRSSLRGRQDSSPRTVLRDLTQRAAPCDESQRHGAGPQGRPPGSALPGSALGLLWSVGQAEPSRPPPVNRHLRLTRHSPAVSTDDGLRRDRRALALIGTSKGSGEGEDQAGAWLSQVAQTRRATGGGAPVSRHARGLLGACFPRPPAVLWSAQTPKLGASPHATASPRMLVQIHAIPRPPAPAMPLGLDPPDHLTGGQQARVRKAARGAGSGQVGPLHSPIGRPAELWNLGFSLGFPHRWNDRPHAEVSSPPRDQELTPGLQVPALQPLETGQKTTAQQLLGTVSDVLLGPP